MDKNDLPQERERSPLTTDSVSQCIPQAGHAVHGVRVDVLVAIQATVGVLCAIYAVAGSDRGTIAAAHGAFRPGGVRGIRGITARTGAAKRHCGNQQNNKQNLFHGISFPFIGMMIVPANVDFPRPVCGWGIIE